MAFQGNLETMPLADLLQWAANGRHTGTISIGNGEVVKLIYISRGVVVSCTSSDPREFLGHFLVSHGAIDEAQLQGAVADQDRESGLLGQILVDRGDLSRDELHAMLRLKAEEAIFELFTWTSGRFKFIEDELPGYELVPISVGVPGLVLEGMRRLDEWQRIRESIPDDLCVPVAVGPLGGGELDPGRRVVLDAVDDDRSVADICLHTHASEFFVCEILLREVHGGRLKIVRPRVLQAPVEAGSATSGAAMLAAAREALGHGDLERAVRRLKAAASLEPHDRELLQDVADTEGEVRDRLAVDGLERDAVPVLDTEPHRIASLDLSPSEGFILSRIDGRSTLGAIVKISPLPELDALLVFWKLVRAGYLRLA